MVQPELELVLVEILAIGLYFTGTCWPIYLGPPD